MDVVEEGGNEEGGLAAIVVQEIDCAIGDAVGEVAFLRAAGVRVAAFDEVGRVVVFRMAEVADAVLFVEALVDGVEWFG